MKIVHVLAPAHAGGLERVVHALAIGQRRRGHTVTAVPVVEAWSADHPFAAPLLREGIDIRPVTVPARAYRRERAELRELLAQLRPNVLHSHGYHTDVVVGGVARRLGVATVSTAHGFTRGTWRNRLYEYLDKQSLKRFDAVAAVSRPLADELLQSGLQTDRVYVVSNAWSRISTPLDRDSARQSLGLDAGAFVVGWVGRMSYEKGLDVFVDALGLLKDVPVTACAVGDGPERQLQEARAAASGLDRIRWPGLVQEAGRYFGAFDLLVLSSRTEGVPMVVLEAMAAGVPLVATAVGGIPDVVSQNEALLVPPEKPDALATAIRSVLEQPERARARAAAAQTRLAAEFSEEPWLRRYDEIYQAAIDRVVRPGPA